MAAYVLNTVPRTGLPPVSDEKLDAEERESRLDLAVNYQITQGSTLASQNDFEAVMTFGRPVNPVLHVLLTIFTLGLWPTMGAFGRERECTLRVDEYGEVTLFTLRG